MPDRTSGEEAPATVTALVLGQVPPPYHGQAVMIAAFLGGSHDGVQVDFVPMRYSARIDEVGRLRPGKIVELLRVVGGAVSRLARGRIDVLYYPPAGSGMVPVLRDIVTLLVLRRFGVPIAFHFHAMGLEASYRALGRPLQALFRAAYFRPDGCICLASTNVAEIEFLDPAEVHVVPYGIPDVPATPSVDDPPADGVPTILFLGNLIASKGVERLLTLGQTLEREGVAARIVMVGAAPSEEVLAAYQQHPAARSGRVVFTGPMYGDDKLAWLRRADVFCFPTTYESENFPVVLIEALRAGLPIVCSGWRGIPEIVEDGRSGFIVDPNDEIELRDAVVRLLEDDELRAATGRAARARYEACFTEDRYRRGLSEALRSIAGRRGRS